MKILIVEDSPTMRRIIKNTLKRIGYEDVEEAEDGVEALAALGNAKIDFIITDWNMPKMSGLDFTKRVKSNPDYGDVPILMVTTRSVEQDVLDAFEAGAASYIVKPFTPQVMKEKIDEILKQGGDNE
ncbi:MAG: response regulator [Candidatus Marinimicrobia bacterium]|nr:response regulator [Candidatus Neomarinimicrobiota bacterium]MCF7880552.1 response regulator [Candidatus Neomarinimicrobiota bacterium]